MRKQYEEPAAEVLIVRMERNLLVYNHDFDEDDDNIFDDNNG